MEQASQLDSGISFPPTEAGNAHDPESDHPESVIRTEKVDRAAADLHADFQRQRAFLSQAQFDRLALRRNLTPPEMVAVLAKLASMGVTINERAPDTTEDNPNSPLATERHDPSTASNESTSASRARDPYALLSRREEVKLGRQIQLALRVQENLDVAKTKTSEEKQIIERGRAARERMVLANLRLVRFVISNVRRPIKFLDSWDLFQEGVVGLMRAVEKFDPELGLKFSTYALWWIRQSIFRGLDDTDRTIRVPVHRLESIRRLRVTTRRLAHELNRDPTIRELSDALNWPIEKTTFIQRLTELECVSLDAPLGEDRDGSIADLIASKEPGPFEATREAQRVDLLQRLIERLTPRQQMVIERRFGVGGTSTPETLQQIGDDLGVTRERIRQIEAKALRRLAKWVNQRMYDALL